MRSQHKALVAIITLQLAIITTSFIMVDTISPTVIFIIDVTLYSMVNLAANYFIKQKEAMAETKFDK